MNNFIKQYSYRGMVALALSVAATLTSAAQTPLKKKTVLKAESIETPALTVDGKSVVGGVGSILSDAVLENYSFKTTDNVFIGNKSGTGISGLQTPLNNPLGSRSVFSLNNQANLSHPLLFGYFADNNNRSDAASNPVNMAQLGINTTDLIDSAALTVRGGLAVVNYNRSASNSNFNVANGAYCNFLMWVERGIVSENYAVAPMCSWDGSTSDCSGAWDGCGPSPWGDFVFENNYQLRPLREVEAFVKKEKHLPEIPSVDEIATKGYLIHNMNKNFIVKIEELTLYAIEQEKKMDSQQLQIELLKSQLKAYESLISEVEKLKAIVNNKK
jgi:hypothetical protein